MQDKKDFSPAARRGIGFDQLENLSRDGPLALTARGIENTKASMSARGATQNTNWRAFLVGFALWLLALQGLNFHRSHEFNPSRFVENVLISADGAFGEFCGSWAEDESPEHTPGDNASHCVWCKSCARDASLAPLLRAADLKLLFGLGRNSSFVGSAENRGREPPGWTRPWSSRAPPSIS